MNTSPPDALDARLIPCAIKHTLIFRRWAELSIGGSFVLLNDHRPEPLRRQFEQLVPGCFEWSEVEPNPDGFAVRLTRLRPDPSGFNPNSIAGCGIAPAGAEDNDGSVLVRLQIDYRDLPVQEARGRCLRIACGLSEGTELQADLPAPDPELDHALTAANLTFRGGMIPDRSAGWRYAITRAPVD